MHEIAAHADDAVIVSAVISMGRSLGYRVIAEGLETEEQLVFLRTQRCSEGQGNYFSGPVGAAQFVRLLETGLPALVLQ